MKTIFSVIGWTLAYYTFVYATVFTIRKAWADAENRTKKVCDICFRDIKLWNEKVKESEAQKRP